MRPGQNAPEYVHLFHRFRVCDAASMRPGQNAPEYLVNTRLTGWRILRFNEAGAKCPGIHDRTAMFVAVLDLLQ